eukprot:m.3795 g.3795  ORF g.3795 m.3795 type:complete len:475 (+) comp9820_c0_seq1:98-1522(+)
MEAFYDTYNVVKELGEGGFGTVFECSAKTSERRYAAKRIDPSKLRNDDDEEKVKNEIKICGMVRHQNVVRLRQCFGEDKSFMLVFELLEGGELFDLIASWESYSERDARHCIRQVLLALSYLESRRIVHRDLKPENLMLVKPPRNGRIQDVSIKLVDFGIAKLVPEGDDKILTDTSGTAYYLAPETLKELPLGYPVDVWAAGIVLYILLIGSMPFWLGEKGKGEMFLKIVNGEYSLEDPEWDTVSHQAKMLVTDMLTIDQDERITASEALAKPWINQLGLAPPTERKGTLQKLKAFNAKRRLRGIVFALIAHRRLLRTPLLSRKESQKENDSSSDGYASDSSSLASGSEANLVLDHSQETVRPLKDVSGQKRSSLLNGADKEASTASKSSLSSGRDQIEPGASAVAAGHSEGETTSLSRYPLASSSSAYSTFSEEEETFVKLRSRARAVTVKDKSLLKKHKRRSIRDLVLELNL